MADRSRVQKMIIVCAEPSVYGSLNRPTIFLLFRVFRALTLASVSVVLEVEVGESKAKSLALAAGICVWNE